MRVRKLSLLIPCSLFLVTFAYGEQALNYVLSEPRVAWRANNTTNLAENVLAATNSAFAAKAGSWSADADANVYQQVSGTTAGKPVMTLRSVDVGFPVERNKPRYYLGSALTPPGDDVDWDATYAYYLENFGETGASVTDNFLFDRNGQAVYVTRGETSTFKWIRRDEDGIVDTNNMIVVASPLSEGRPKNIFLTDAIYGGRTVDLSDKFVKLFGPADLLTVKKGHKPTGVTVGGAESTQEYVTSGVYIDEANGQKTLYAAGELTGQFVLAYYDSGNYQKLVDVITVQVSPPETIVCNANVGDALKPTGRGYGITGLTASPTTLDDFDEQGPFLYQHKGTKGYSPKNGDVFALRPTDDATRNQTQIYWFEKDNQGVNWPFEVNEYRVQWPDTMPVLVRGNLKGDAGKGMTIPAVYTASITDYQESDGEGRHATDPVNGVFAPTGAGKAILKLTGDDNIWFVPVRSVLRGDPAWFSPSYVTRKVGMECAMRTAASLNGLAPGRTLALAEDVPGYVYVPASDPVWNPNAYSESGTGAGGYPSVVYPVTASMDAAKTNEVEVWWSARYVKRGDDMPEPLVYPAAPQNYRAAWPDGVDAPEIVLASQLGGAGLSVARDPDGHCVMFASDAVRMDLDAMRYFSAKGGMAGLWHMREDGPPDGTDIVTFGDVLAIKDDPTLVPPGTTGWKYLAATWTTSNICYAAVLPNGTINTRTEPFEHAAELAGVISNAYIGGVTVPLTVVDDLSTWERPMSEQEIVQIAWKANGVSTLDRTRLYDCEHVDEYIAKHASVTNMPYQLLSPGGPRLGTAVIRADAMPTVYRQPVKGGVGYNPNEEHAFVQAGSGGYVTWAFRCDLNAADNVSKPGVLVEYVQDGVQKMTYFNVALTNERYRTLSASCTAGTLLPGPEPFLRFNDPFLAEDYWLNDSPVPYRDRRGHIWARCAGDFDIYMYYAMQSTYDWPSGVRAARPEDGSAVPWLAYVDNSQLSTPNPQPHPWRWNVAWPDEDKVPKMKIGQTLTTAADGLPEVWNAKAMALLYPVTNVDETALLYDPTKSRRQSTGIAFARLGDLGLSADPNGKLHSYKGNYYFREMPPSVSDRLYLDVSDVADMKLVLKGVKDSDAVGELRINVLEDCEYAALTNVITTSDGSLREAWNAAARELAEGPLRATTTVLAYDATTTHSEYKSTYAAADHYALTAMGMTNWVVLIENDATNSFCDAGNPIDMHVFRVAPEYDLARVVTREDAGNLLSQQLTVSYTEHFAAQSRGYEFEWRKAEPLPNGTVPVIDEHSTFHADQRGLTTFVIGGQGDTLKNMVNAYYSCRYRAATNSPAYKVMGDKWSEWCSPPGLAEGWVQRVLNNVTPFSQRVTDLYENAVDSTVSMIAQAGKPYTGDVALNQDNLSEVGLVELYRTILAKAESMSLMLGLNDAGANKQLLLAVERLADMYGVLGDEAYADALNPTIGFGTAISGSNGASYELEYGALSTAMFCFDNQVPSLLDEELALMRGRSCVNAPDNTVGPYYNRLVWNFTKGITAGEVAYAVNYAISGTSANGTMSAEQARAQFPQGHGDAYGHYLSALQGYYRLLRNPYFSWDGIVGMGEMNVANNAVNVDYYDEATFAKFAANVAKAADKTVELTALKHWRDNYAGTVGGGYVDTNVTNAFGYGEWASRGGFGALCNWAVANDLLPEEEIVDETGAKYEDVGLLHIDRGTAEGIGELVSAVKSIQRTTDRMDAGMNPLGLNDKAVPFDLTPVGGADGATHYEQIRQRAQDALVNAKDVLDNAQTSASRVRQLEDTASTAISDQLALAERQFANADFLSAYANLQSKIMLYQRSVERMSMELNLVSTLEHYRSNTVHVADEDYYKTLAAQKVKLRDAKIGAAWLESYCEGLAEGAEAVESSTGIAGLSNSVGDLAKRVIAGVFTFFYTAGKVAQAACETVAEYAEYECEMAEARLEKSETDFQTQALSAAIAERVVAAADEQLAILADIKTAWASLETAQTKVAALLAKADGLRDELQLVRQQAAKNISKLRYSDMFFRKTTSAALSQYGASFAIARTYAFLAAKAYGYETGSPLESTEEGREILRQIVGARMIGETTDDGGVLATDDGDAGLSGILAQLDANWANRKTQLGINNPQPYATWFSLRHELFRILQGELGDNAWRTELAKHWVEDIKTDAEFRRHCQPFASQFGLAEKEPALVIPFETTIDFAYNLFGKPLAFDDSQFDSTYYATKIASAGVWFEGYNEKVGVGVGVGGGRSAFAKTPNVYLVPVGTDKMRVPGSDGEEIASFDVVDQVVPAPYPLTAAEIADANWLPSYLDGDLGGVDGETRIRRHPSFRAYYGNVGDSPTDAQLDATRLTGRSVWNTRWLLVIPAGTLGSDRDQALKAFIYGLDTDRDGVIDVKPVSDIRIGFKTYSNSGN